MLAGGFFTTDYLRDKVYEVIANFDNLEALQTSNAKIKLTECYHKATISHTVYYSSVAFIVIHEVFVYPVFHRCLPQIESLQKIIIGMLLQSFCVVGICNRIASNKRRPNPVSVQSTQK